MRFRARFNVRVRVGLDLPLAGRGLCLEAREVCSHRPQTLGLQTCRHLPPRRRRPLAAGRLHRHQ